MSLVSIYRNDASEPVTVALDMPAAIQYAETEIATASDKPVFWLRDEDGTVKVLPESVETFLRTTTRHPGYLPSEHTRLVC